MLVFRACFLFFLYSNRIQEFAIEDIELTLATHLEFKAPLADLSDVKTMMESISIVPGLIYKLFICVCAVHWCSLICALLPYYALVLTVCNHNIDECDSQFVSNQVMFSLREQVPTLGECCNIVLLRSSRNQQLDYRTSSVESPWKSWW